jgi:DNA-binding NarL/FixJ family response regulator
MRVFVLAGYPTVRAGLAALVREQPGWEVAGQAAPSSLDERALAQPPVTLDILLVDLEDTEEASLVQGWLQALRPRGLLVLAPVAMPDLRGPMNQDDLQALSRLSRDTYDAGIAFGALRRDALPEEIVAGAQAVSAGIFAVDRWLVPALLATPEPLALEPQTAAGATTGESLTARELDVIQLMAEGLANKSIAARLRISEHTVKFHVSSIMTKLGAASRTEAVTLAARRGLLIL